VDKGLYKGLFQISASRDGTASFVPPNGLRISRRERAAYESAKIATISREAVGLHARVGCSRGKRFRGTQSYDHSTDDHKMFSARFRLKEPPIFSTRSGWEDHQTILVVECNACSTIGISLNSLNNALMYLS
jgi:hypothetical protein